ncbi:hypothetical protein CLU79DRAFT_836905 [Phycomyces nitens]|nr:hypothetical protein CLU79DRAFT_836905 [Phycomyces nitens]
MSSRNFRFDSISREVTDGQSLMLGRFDKGIKKHAFIEFQSPALYIKDIRSSFGTFLNGFRLSQSSQESSRYPLRDNDILQLGQVSEKDIDTNKLVLMKLRIRHRSNVRK